MTARRFPPPWSIEDIREFAVTPSISALECCSGLSAGHRGYWPTDRRRRGQFGEPFTLAVVAVILVAALLWPLGRLPWP
jgi:hypothetical protein